MSASIPATMRNTATSCTQMPRSTKFGSNTRSSHAAISSGVRGCGSFTLMTMSGAAARIQARPTDQKTAPTTPPQSTSPGRKLKASPASSRKK